MIQIMIYLPCHDLSDLSDLDHDPSDLDHDLYDLSALCHDLADLSDLDNDLSDLDDLSDLSDLDDDLSDLDDDLSDLSNLEIDLSDLDDIYLICLICRRCKFDLSDLSDLSENVKSDWFQVRRTRRAHKASALLLKMVCRGRRWDSILSIADARPRKLRTAVRWYGYRYSFADGGGGLETRRDNEHAARRHSGIIATAPPPKTCRSLTYL